MHLTFGTGIFWIIIALAVGETIIKTARAFAKRGSREDSGVPELERRIGELEKRVADQAELLDAREQMLSRLEEKVEFTDRLLAERARSPE